MRLNNDEFALKIKIFKNNKIAVAINEDDPEIILKCLAGAFLAGVDSVADKTGIDETDVMNITLQIVKMMKERKHLKKDRVIKTQIGGIQ